MVVFYGAVALTNNTSFSGFF